MSKSADIAAYKNGEKVEKKVPSIKKSLKALLEMEAGVPASKDEEETVKRTKTAEQPRTVERRSIKTAERLSDLEDQVKILKKDKINLIARIEVLEKSMDSLTSRLTLLEDYVVNHIPAEE